MAQAADPRTFPQTGFRVDHDPFWDYFQKRGGVRAFGYPASESFAFLGCTTQFFQRLVLQQCAGGGVATLNLLDAGLLPYTRINGSTFPAADPALAARAPAPGEADYGRRVQEFVSAQAPDLFEGEPVRFHQTFLGTVRGEDAFPGGDANPALLPLLNLELWGFPTSPPMRDPSNGNFVYQRFQRGIMHYDKGCGCTQGLLLADYLKALLTGQHLPPDLAEQARSSPLLLAAVNGRPPSGTSFANAFRLPTAAFRPVVPTTPTPALPPVTVADQQRFIAEVGEVAKRLRVEVGLPPSLLVAMAINETGWGRSELAVKANNYFGIKAHRGPGTAGVYEVETWEVVNGERVVIRAAFRAYNSLEENVRDLGAFLRASPRYNGVWAFANDGPGAARALFQAGYATDPVWPEKLASLMQRHNLQALDQ